MKSTIKTIYQTLLHAGFVAMVFFYTSDKYSIVRVDQPQQASCCKADELTAFLDSKMTKRGK